MPATNSSIQRSNHPQPDDLYVPTKFTALFPSMTGSLNRKEVVEKAKIERRDEDEE